MELWLDILQQYSSIHFHILVANLTQEPLFGPIRVTQTGFLEKSAVQVKEEDDNND